MVFNLGDRERGLRAGAPEDRLFRFVNEALLDENGERLQDLRLVSRVEREIGILPVAEHAEALKLPALDLDEAARKGLRALPHFHRREAARFLDHLVFDREPVAVPARHVGRAKAEHGLRFHHQILEDLVQRRAHVDIAIRERRAVVQDEQLRAGARFLNLLVKLRLLPGLEDLRFTSR